MKFNEIVGRLCLRIKKNNPLDIDGGLDLDMNPIIFIRLPVACEIASVYNCLASAL